MQTLPEYLFSRENSFTPTITRITSVKELKKLKYNKDYLIMIDSTISFYALRLGFKRLRSNHINKRELFQRDKLLPKDIKLKNKEQHKDIFKDRCNEATKGSFGPYVYWDDNSSLYGFRDALAIITDTYTVGEIMIDMDFDYNEPVIEVCQRVGDVDEIAKLLVGFKLKFNKAVLVLVTDRKELRSLTSYGFVSIDNPNIEYKVHTYMLLK